MPLGIVSDSDFKAALAELEKKSNQVESKLDDASQKESDETRAPSGEVKSIHRGGRTDGAVEVPDSLRKMIGADAIENGNQSAKAITDFLGINKNQVAAYKNGATSTASYHNPTDSLKNHMTRTREKITSRASRKLLSALDHITDAKLKEATAPELASVARSMGTVIRDVAPPSEQSEAKQPQFVIFAPKIVSEDKFPVIDLTSQE